MTYNNIRTILPIYNNEEKVDEINRLIDILSKRKRYSILLAMLLVFQKYNFQKLLKEFLVEGVRQLIISNPFKVVSFNGVPFTAKNCFMGMRVIIGKHKMIQKQMFEGYEYLNVNLIYTSIFLSDEIAKICKGSKNSKPVHSSLLDELDIIENNNNINNNPENNINNNNEFLNEKRNRSKSNSEFNLSMNSAEQGTVGKNLSNNNNYDNNINNISVEQNSPDNNINYNSNLAFPRQHDIISLGDSDESENFGNKNKYKNNIRNRKTHNKNNHFNNNRNSEQINLFENIFYQKDINYFRCPIQDYFNIWNFDKSSPLNTYLKDNLKNISNLKNIFDFMKIIGSQGKNNLQNLMNFIPQLNKASSLNQKNLEKNENIDSQKDIKDLKESKEILDKIENMNTTFQEYENKKKKLINIYQRIKSIVGNIKQSETIHQRSILNDDIKYLNKINKRFEETLSEIIPLFTQLYNINKKCSIKDISMNLYNISKTLNKNNLAMKSFSGFIEGLLMLFPHESTNSNTVNDLMLNESLSDKEREDKFREIIIKKKTNLINSIDNYLKYFYS